MSDKKHTTIAIDISGSSDKIMERVKEFIVSEIHEPISLWVFNNKLTQVSDRISGVEALKLLDDQAYTPNRSTALYDTVGYIVSNAQPWDRIVIATDGIDTKSKTWTHEGILELINASELEITCIGCLLDDYKTCRAMFVSRLRSTVINTRISAMRITLPLLNTNDESPVMLESPNHEDYVCV